MNNNPYDVRRLDESCRSIEENGVRSFLIAGTERALLIDSGFGTGNIRQIAEGMTDLPITLINTHTDRDHIGCNSLFEKAYMHPAEYDRYCQGAGAGLAVRPLWEGDIIDIGGRRFEVILIPGHTPGSIALLDAENRILFSGDSVQSGVIYMFGPGRNIKAYINSMEKLAALSGQFDTVYPSHGEIPISGVIINELIAGAKKVLNAEVKGSTFERADISAKVYDIGAAKFLYE